jgi:hypothetical protein
MWKQKISPEDNTVDVETCRVNSQLKCAVIDGIWKKGKKIKLPCKTGREGP